MLLLHVHIELSEADFCWTRVYHQVFRQTGDMNSGSCLSLEMKWSVLLLLTNGKAPLMAPSQVVSESSWGSAAPRTHSAPPASRVFPLEEEGSSGALTPVSSMKTTAALSAAQHHQFMFDFHSHIRKKSQSGSVKLFQNDFYWENYKKCTVQS